MPRINLQPGDRIGILNRGEAALRFLRAVREHNALHGTRLSPVAFFLPEEEEAPFVRQADLALPLSAFPASREAIAYLDPPRLLAALEAGGCRAAWPGWGFLSEDAAFARELEERGLAFLGPPWQAMELLGDKIAAKELAERAGVPVLPWSRRPVAGLEEARAAAGAVGFPCIIKAAGAGGGRGIRAVRRPEDLEAQYRSAREEALRVTVGDRLFVELLVERARHLEVQAMADRHGTVLTFGVRDCSVQRRNQKIIEETPPAGVKAALAEAMERAAADLVRAAGYESAGTVEFLYDLDRGRFTFMEVNTRLQVEHPITEQAYGVDLVQMQLQVALGKRLPGSKPRRRAVAIEARLNAEDPEREFLPAPGKVLCFQPPAGPGIRVDSGVEEGSRIPPQFDSMIAKIIAYAPDRPRALARLERALAETRLLLEGGTTNRAFLRELLRRPPLRRGGVSTRFVEELLQEAAGGAALIPREEWGAALAAAAVERCRASHREELANFQQQLASGGYPREITLSAGLEVGMRLQGRRVNPRIRAVAPSRYHLLLNGRTVPLEYHSRERESLLVMGGRRFTIQTVGRAGGLQVEVDGVPYPVELESGGLLRAPSPALVLSIAAQPGQKVAPGDVLVTLEAMKMEILVLAEEAGTVKEVCVRPGAQVAAGQPLVRLDTGIEDDAEMTRPARSEAAGAEDGAGEETAGLFAAAGEDQASILSQEYLAVFLGYDHGPDCAPLLGRMLAMVGRDEERRRQLTRLLVRSVEIYVDVERLFAASRGSAGGAFTGGAFAAQSPQAGPAARPVPFQELLSHYLRRRRDREKGLPEPFIQALRRALRWYLGEEGAAAAGAAGERAEAGPAAGGAGGGGAALDVSAALLQVYRSHADLAAKQDLLYQALFALESLTPPQEEPGRISDLLDEVAYLSQSSNPALSDAAIHARARLVDRVILEHWRAAKRAKVGKVLQLLLRHRRAGRAADRLAATLIGTGHHVSFDLGRHFLQARGPDAMEQQDLILEILARRFTRDREFLGGELLRLPGFPAYRARTAAGQREWLTLTAVARAERLEALLEELGRALEERSQPDPGRVEVILLALLEEPSGAGEEPLRAALRRHPLRASWASLGILLPDGQERFLTFHHAPEGRWEEDSARRGFNPRAFRELRVGRLAAFQQERVYTSESVHLLALKSRDNPRDERLVALVEVPSARPQFDEQGRLVRMVALENVFMEAVYALRAEQARRRRRLYWNRIVVHIPALLATTLEQNRAYAARLAARTVDLGLEKIVVYSHRPTPGAAPPAASSPPAPGRAGAATEEVELVFENISGSSFSLRGRTPSEEPLVPMDAYVARVVRARQRGTLYPYEILKMLTRSGYPVSEGFPRGEFEEFDIRVDERTGSQQIVSVKGRPSGQNGSNVIFGLLTSHPPGRGRAAKTPLAEPQHRLRCPDPRPGWALKRVVLLADPTTDMGSLAEAECRRVIAALDLAEQRRLPVEWLPVSAGARIEMDSGTENLDWTARVLRRIVQFTQAGGEINILVAGVNIGAQSYWNAEATMLMHTRGLLVMTDEAAMLLTGKKALDFSGSVSAEDNVGIGGAARIMGPNGQAQVRARTLYEAYSALLRHYELTWREPGRAWPERAASSDPADRDVGASPYQDALGQGFRTIADIFSPRLNPERKKPFDMRQLLGALVDQDGPVFERWAEMKDAEIAIVWEARLGGFSAGLLGIESRPLPRIGEVPHDGPESWTGGTLFPLSSKKIARAINAFSGRLPLVILANLSGFDGSPESLRKLQLEYGAEIGRAVVNFRGPIVFVVTARYHGGAYVVFSKALNENLRAAAIEGAFASVIGGAPAAAVVFPGLVLKETDADPRIEEARARLRADRAGYRKEFDSLFRKVQAEKQAALARRFDQVHSVERARAVGSIDDILPLARLRPYLIERLEEGMRRFAPQG